MKRVIRIKGMACANCAKRVAYQLDVIGASEINVDLEKGTAEFEDNGLTFAFVRDAIEDMGFDVLD